MKLLWKLNCFLLIIVIFISLVNTTKHKISEKASEQNKNHLKEKENKFDLNEFYKLEETKYQDIDKYLDKDNTQKLTESLDELNNYNNFMEKNLTEQKPNIEQDTLTKKFYKKNKKNLKKLNSKSSITKITKKPVPNATFNLEKNPHFPNSPAEIASNTKYSKCEFKSGFLYLVKNSEKLSKNPLRINAIPVYVEMNMKDISFQMGVMQKSAFNQVDLEKILRINKKFSNSFCFEIVENEIIQKTLAKIPVTLCAKDYSTMVSWVSAIQQFKNCLNRISDKNSQQENKTLIDFENINKLLKDNHTYPGKIPQEIKKIYYQKSSPYIKSTKKSESEMRITKQLKSIVETLEKGSLQKNKMRRRMNSKLKNAENMAKDLRMKQILINSILEKRINNEKEKEDQIKNNEHKQREVQLLRAVQQRIRQYKKSEMKEYHEILDNRIKEIKSKANSEAQGIMHAILNQQKLSDYEECYDDRLFEFKNKSYNKEVCFRLFGEHKGETCEEKGEFCGMCCGYHIGIRYENKLIDCKNKCTKIINGNKIIEKEKAKDTTSNKTNTKSKTNTKTKTKNKNKNKKNN